MTNIENNNIENTQEERNNGEVTIEEVESKAASESDSFMEIVLSKELEIGDLKHKRLFFNFDKLTADDFIKIENEMTEALGKFLIQPEYSSEFLIRVAARACTESISSENLLELSIKDFNILRRKVRAFFLN